MIKMRFHIIPPKGNIMTFEENEELRYLPDNTENKIENWLVCSFRAITPNGNVVVNHHYRNDTYVSEVPLTRIKRFVYLEENSLQKFVQDNMGELTKLIKKGVDNLLKTKVEVSVDPSSDSAIYIGKMLQVNPQTSEAFVGDKIAEILGWEIVTWHVTPASYYEPEEVDESVEGFYRDNIQAAAKVLELVFNKQCEHLWEAEALQKDYEESKTPESFETQAEEVEHFYPKTKTVTNAEIGDNLSEFIRELSDNWKSD